ncbi:MAG: FkbM family methyltransferase [Gillisia sp.]
MTILFFFDIGANYGQTIDEIIGIFNNYEIHSFEPSPSVFEFLRNKRSKVKNLNIWNYEVGSSTKSLILNENTNQNMSSFLEIGKDGWGSIEHKTPVPVITIDEFCEKQKITKIDVLKIDTQGFEFEVLKGTQKSMKENRIGLLYFEVTFIDMYKDLPLFGELYNFAVNNGFELVAIYPIIYKKNLAGWTDVLFKHKNYQSISNLNY